MTLSVQAQAILDTLIETDYKKPFAEEAAFAALVAASGEAQAEPYALPEWMPDDIAVTEQSISGISRIFTLQPAEPTERSEKQVLFYHGGAFLLYIFDTHLKLAISLIRQTGCTIHILDYPLAPTHTHVETYQSMMETYRWVLDRAEPRNVVLLGDSVGAHMAIAAAQMALEEGLAQPTLIIALSPWIDFSDELPGKAEREPGDPIIGMVSLHGIPATWCPDIMGRGSCPPDLQYGPFEGMAPIYIQIGSTEVLYVDALELTRLAKAADVAVELEVGEGLWHTYALYQDMPEGERAAAAIAKRIRES